MGIYFGCRGVFGVMYMLLTEGSVAVKALAADVICMQGPFFIGGFVLNALQDALEAEQRKKSSVGSTCSV